MNQLACKLTITETKLIEMLQENTGRHFLDSGGAYGRHWEQNQKVEFKSQPEGTLELWERDGKLDICSTLSVFHFLNNRLEYNKEIDNRYRKWCEENERNLCLFNSAEDFATSIGGKGIYGEGEPLTVNTYNGEDLLSQTLQYVYWADDDGAYVLLQIHGGCDVRGGYTDPVAFDVADYNGISIFDNARASIFCEECGKRWEADDGYHWAPDGCYGQGYTNLEDYPATEEQLKYPERPEPCAGVVRVDDEHNGYCPYCGGLLHVAPVAM